LGAASGKKAFNNHIGAIIIAHLATCGGGYLVPYLFAFYEGKGVPATTEISNPSMYVV